VLKNQSLIAQLESLEDLFTDSLSANEAEAETERIWKQIIVLRKRLQLPYSTSPNPALIGNRNRTDSTIPLY
jgi:hypothetical protein